MPTKQRLVTRHWGSLFIDLKSISISDAEGKASCHLLLIYIEGTKLSYEERLYPYAKVKEKLNRQKLEDTPRDTYTRDGHFSLPELSAFVTVWADGSDLDYDLSSTDTCLQHVQRLVQTLQTSSLYLNPWARNDCTRFQTVLQPDMEALVHVLVSLRRVHRW